MEQEKAGGGDQVLAASRVRSERVVAVKMGGREGCEKCFYSPA